MVDGSKVAVQNTNLPLLIQLGSFSKLEKCKYQGISRIHTFIQ